MKNRYYVFVITIVVSLTSATFVNTEKSKDKDSSKARQVQDSSRISKPVKVSKDVKSAWLNRKYFPQLQETPCPFYYNNNRGGC